MGVAKTVSKIIALTCGFKGSVKIVNKVVDKIHERDGCDTGIIMLVRKSTEGPYASPEVVRNDAGEYIGLRVHINKDGGHIVYDGLTGLITYTKRTGRTKTAKLNPLYVDAMQKYGKTLAEVN